MVVLTTRYFNHIKYELYVYCTVLTRPWGSACSTYSHRMETDTCAKKICGYTPIPLRGPYSSTCFWAPSPHSTFYSVWFMVLYLWANRPKLTALEKAHRCTLKVHRSVTHIAQPLSAAQNSSPQTLTVSTVHRYTWPPTLNMEMLWKQNLNIYIRWLWKRGYALLFSQPPFSMYFLHSGWGGEAKNGRKRETGSAQSGERQPSEKVKTVHQQIRQRRTIHHVPGLSEEHKLKQAKL